MPKEISQLEEELARTLSPAARLPLLNDLAWMLRQSDIVQSRAYADEALTLANETGNTFHKARALRALGSAEDFANQPRQALTYLRQAAGYFETLGELDHLIGTHNLIGKTLMYLGDLPGALAIFQANEKIALQGKSEQHRADSLLTQGVVLLRNNEFRQSEKMLRESLAICRTIGFAPGEGRALLNLSALYIEEKRFEEGLGVALEACPIFEKRGDKVDLASSMSNAATALLGLERLDEAETLFMRTREMRIANKEQLHLVNNYISTASLFVLQKRFDEAIRDLELGLEMAKAAHNVFQLTHIHKAFCELEEARGNYKESLAHYKLYHQYEQEVTNENRQRELRNLKVRAEVEKLENENELYRKHTIVLEEANLKISAQKALIEEKNKDITDSIHYARRIQEAMLPSGEELADHLPGSFVFYRPKDIVSGDFYWVAEKDGIVLFAVADCTGHGVPGALMSMIGHNLLHRITSEVETPAPGEVLSRLDHNLRKMLKQNNADSGSNDGMDIVLCAINREKRSVVFSSSRRPLWLFRDGQVTEFKGDRNYVGGKGDGIRPFSTQVFEGKPGDLLYLFTDGYADQFGGPQRKKYQTGRFRQFLLGICEMTTAQQSALLEKEFLEWKGDNEQVDDILVAAIRL